jgi:hypothetical protein
VVSHGRPFDSARNRSSAFSARPKLLSIPERDAAHHAVCPCPCGNNCSCGESFERDRAATGKRREGESNPVRFGWFPSPDYKPDAPAKTRAALRW